MLAKTERLSRTHFATVFRSGKRHHSDTATIITAPHEQFHGSVVVSKKVSKKAVTRNKLRRQVYGLLTTHLKQRGWRGVIIVVIKPAIIQHSTQVRRAALIAQIEHVRDRAYNSTHV